MDGGRRLPAGLADLPQPERVVAQRAESRTPRGGDSAQDRCSRGWLRGAARHISLHLAEDEGEGEH